MKENIEQGFKKSLENFEPAYNPSAWEAMKSKLDAKTPVTPKYNFKWFIAASVTTTILVVSAYLLLQDPSNSPSAEKKDIAATVPAPSSSVENEDATVTVEENKEISQPETESSATNSSVEAAPESQHVSPRTNLPFSSEESDQIEERETVPTTPWTPQLNNQKPLEANATENLIIAPVADICSGESIQLDNANDVSLVIDGPETRIVVPAKTSLEAQLTQPGLYLIRGLNGDSYKFAEEFVVKPAPVVEFTIDPTTKFEKGLPTTKVETSVPGIDHVWRFENTEVQGTKINAHFYTKGSHDITLIVKGANGCTASQTKSIYIEDAYNLMAVNSFRPESTDPTVNRFIPYALKERNVHFTMIVIDPSDGHILFETNDANHGWDGTDRKTGQMVSFETAYIWKVTLMERAENEKRNEYSGQIIPVYSNK